ncbi:hypothetical protein Tco_0735123 [Tanacetum coccineum]
MAEEDDNPGRDIPADPAYYLEDNVNFEGEGNVTTENKGEDEPRGSRLPWLGTRISSGALMRYSAFGRHLEEIHVTWAHLEKKQTRLRTYTNISQEFLLKLETASQITRDAVTTHTKTTSQDLKTASECTTQPII